MIYKGKKPNPIAFFIRIIYTTHLYLYILCIRYKSLIMINLKDLGTIGSFFYCALSFKLVDKNNFLYFL